MTVTTTTTATYLNLDLMGGVVHLEFDPAEAGGFLTYALSDARSFSWPALDSALAEFGLVVVDEIEPYCANDGSISWHLAYGRIDTPQALAMVA